MHHPTARRVANHIVICVHDFSRGGTERIAIGLARHWVEAGRKVTFLCGTTEGGLRDTVDPQVAVVALDPPIRRSLLSRFWLGRAMAAKLPELSADVVFLPGNFHLVLAEPLSRVPARPAIVLKISNPLASHSAFAWPANWLLRRFSGCVDGVATMSTGLEADLRWLVPGHNIQTLFDPVYQNFAITDHLAAEGDEALQLLWVGRFEPQKDAQLALKTIDALRKQCPVRLTMLGDGTQRAQVLRLIARMGLEDCVSAPGHMQSIEPYMQRADALLITSHYEGGPAVAVEALAHGVPVVSTKCSHFLDDIMTAPEAGKIVDSRDPQTLAAALLALRDAGPPPAATLQALVAHLDPETCATAYLDWLDTMVTARVG